MAARRARAKEIAGRLNEAWNASEIGGVRKLSDAVRNHMGGAGSRPSRDELRHGPKLYDRSRF